VTVPSILPPGSTPLEKALEQVAARLLDVEVAIRDVWSPDDCPLDLLPWLAGRAMPAMAYSPIEQGGLPRSEPLAAVAKRHGVTPTQIALAFVLRLPGVIAIPKAGNPAHVRENRQAADIILDDEDLAILDAAFPPPRRKRPLAMI